MISQFYPRKIYSHMCSPMTVVEPLSRKTFHGGPTSALTRMATSQCYIESVRQYYAPRCSLVNGNICDRLRPWLVDVKCHDPGTPSAQHKTSRFVTQTSPNPWPRRTCYEQLSHFIKFNAMHSVKWTCFQPHSKSKVGSVFLQCADIGCL